MNLYTKNVTFKNTFDIGEMETYTRIQFFGQVIQTIREKHDEYHAIYSENSKLEVTVVRVTYNDHGLMHICEHKVFHNGQPGNIHYKNLSTWSDVAFKVGKVMKDQFQVVKVILNSSQSGEAIDIASLIDKGGNQATSDDAGRKNNLLI
jgi:hypothetical protein